MIKLDPLYITRDLILKYRTEEQLMEHYLGVRIQKGLIRSPLRPDKNPTCSFFRNKAGVLIFKDFSGDFYGDFITVVMKLFSCSYYKALRIIANDLGIIRNPALLINKAKIEYSNVVLDTKEDARINVELRESFSESELNFWKRYGITEKTLKHFNVFPCKNIWVNSNLFHVENKSQLVFGYYWDTIKDIEFWRIYFPGKKKYKFISNWKKTQIQGLRQLEYNNDEYLVITKSLKDVMVLHELGIKAIAPNGETMFMSDAQFNKLKLKFKRIILFYDNDLAGIHNMNRIRKKFDVEIVYIPRKYKVKDISDFYKEYGKDRTLKLIDSVRHG